MTTPHRARSTLRRGSSGSGKKLPLRSLGIFASASPAGIDTIRGPSRSAPRSALRSVPSVPHPAGRSPPPRSAPAARLARPWAAHPPTPPLHPATRGEHVLDRSMARPTATTPRKLTTRRDAYGSYLNPCNSVFTPECCHVFQLDRGRGDSCEARTTRLCALRRRDWPVHWRHQRRLQRVHTFQG